MQRENYYLIENELVSLHNVNAFIHINNCRQLDLLDSRKLSSLSKDNETSRFSPSDIEGLWHLGFINADIVVSTNSLDIEGLIFIEELDTGFYYSDNRKVQKYETYDGVLKTFEKIPDYIELMFHPYRCYTLLHISRELTIATTTAMQYFLGSDGFQKISKFDTEYLELLFSKEETMNRFQYWNSVSLFSALLEPSVHSYIYKKISVTHFTIEKTEKKLDELYSITKNILLQMGIEKVTYFRDEVCHDADVLDKNRYLHLVIRLMDRQDRQKIKGKIAGAVLLKEMTETFRRHLEKVFKIQMPEEEECGHATINLEYKKESIGSTRLLDGDRAVANQFLRRLGLDYGVRVNVYVEGDTEFHAINSYFSHTNHVSIINLKGSFVERRGKGLAFRESLNNDLKSKLFSIIVLDSDVSDNCRVTKEAAKNKEIVGRFFISEPDFEFGNFSINELIDIVNGLAAKNKIILKKSLVLNKEILAVNSGKELQSIISKEYSFEMGKLIKGKLWGQALSDYAVENHIKEKIKPIIEIYQMLNSTFQCNTPKPNSLIPKL